jgi:hypothetical protein
MARRSFVHARFFDTYARYASRNTHTLCRTFMQYGELCHQDTARVK